VRAVGKQKGFGERPIKGTIYRSHCHQTVAVYCAAYRDQCLCYSKAGMASSSSAKTSSIAFSNCLECFPARTCWAMSKSVSASRYAQREFDCNAARRACRLFMAGIVGCFSNLRTRDVNSSRNEPSNGVLVKFPFLVERDCSCPLSMTLFNAVKSSQE